MTALGAAVLGAAAWAGAGAFVGVMVLPVALFSLEAAAGAAPEGRRRRGEAAGALAGFNLGVAIVCRVCEKMNYVPYTINIFRGGMQSFIPSEICFFQCRRSREVTLRNKAGARSRRVQV